MGAEYLSQLLTPEVLATQARTYGRRAARPESHGPEPLGEAELDFISQLDSFYLATVTSEGWPYVQHRGGPKGFLHALDPHTLAFADLKGNRQLISAGNLSSGDGRVSLIAVDYPRRERFKLIGHAKLVEPSVHPELVPKGSKAVERLVVIDVVAFDWNCPAYITPRYTVEDIERLAKPLQQRVADLEAELSALRSRAK